MISSQDSLGIHPINKKALPSEGQGTSCTKENGPRTNKEGIVVLGLLTITEQLTGSQIQKIGKIGIKYYSETVKPRMSYPGLNLAGLSGTSPGGKRRGWGWIGPTLGIILAHMFCFDKINFTWVCRGVTILAPS